MSKTPFPGPIPSDEYIRVAEILEVGKSRSRAAQADNSRAWKNYQASQICVDYLIETTPIERLALLTLTTNTCDAKAANQALGKVAEYLRRCGIQFVRFFERSRTLKVHWHLIVALPFDIVTDYLGSSSTSELAWMIGHGVCRDLAEQELTSEAQQLQRKMKEKLKAAGIGHVARIEPIRSPGKIGAYCGKYILGSTPRLRRDERLRFWAASKNCRIGNIKVQVMTQWSRIARVKMAAYCYHNGWKSLAEARDADSHWQFRSRAFLEKKRTLLYIQEEDFASDWGIEFSPVLAGVTILQTNRCLGLPPVPYFHVVPPQDSCLREWLEHRRRTALSLPLDFWREGGAA